MPRRTPVYVALVAIAAIAAVAAVWAVNRAAPEPAAQTGTSVAVHTQAVTEAPGDDRAPADADAERSVRRLPDVVARLLEGPRAPNDAQRQVARDFHRLYGAWSGPQSQALFAKPSEELESQLQERMEWFRASLGECGPGRPLTVKDAENARFVYVCDNGELEAGFALDDRSLKIVGLAVGARHVEPAEAVQEAARNLVSLLQEWNLGLFALTFSEKYEAEKVRQFFADIRANRGVCKLGAPDLVSPRGGLFALSCERAERLLKLELDDNDQIRTYSITAPRPEP